MSRICFALALVAACWAGPSRADAAGAKTVCIAPFSDSTGDETFQGVATGLPDLLLAGFGAHKQIKIVDRDHLEELMREQSLALHGLADPAVAARTGKLLGAQKFITGGVMLSGKQLIIVAHVLDVATARVEASEKVTGDPSQIVTLSVALANRLAKVLNVKFDPDPPERPDPSPLASLHFLRGLGYFHSGNYDRAAMEFMISGDIEPNHSTFRYWIGLSYLRLNEPTHAYVELHRFLRESPKSPKAAQARAVLARCKAPRSRLLPTTRPKQAPRRRKKITFVDASPRMLDPNDAERIQRLIGQLKSDSRDLRREAADVLGTIRPAAPATIAALKGRLDDDELWVRLFAAESLAKLGHPTEAIPVLEAAMKDEHPRMRQSAVRVLGEMGPAASPALKAIVGALNDKHPGVREWSAYALGEIGPAAVGALPALSKAAWSRHEEVRDAAQKALRKLRQAQTGRKKS